MTLKGEGEFGIGTSVLFWSSALHNICAISCHEEGEERWTQSSREEEEQGASASHGWLIGIAGRRFHCCFVFSCLGVVCFSFNWSRRSLSTTHGLQTKPTHNHTGSGDAVRGRWREMGWERHPFTLHRIFKPVINYNLASQRQGLGEFLC